MREGWSKGTLGDLLSRRTDRLGSEPDPGVLTVSEEHGLVDQVAHWGRRVATEDVSKYKVVNYGDVVYNIYLLWAGAIGQSRFDSQMVTSPVYEVFRPIEGVVPEYVGFILQDPKMLNLFDGISIGTVGRRRRAPWKDFLKVPVLVPPLHEQGRIVDLMDSVDAAISAAQTEVDTAVELRSQVLGHTLGNSQEDWERTSLESLINHQIGGAWGKSPGDSEVEVISFGTKAYGAGTSLDPSSGTKRSVTSLQYKRRQLFAGDIILEVSGGSDTQPVGRALIVDDDMPGVIPSSFFRLLRFDKVRVSPQFILLNLQSMYEAGVTREWQSNTTGIRNLNVKGFLSSQIALPSLDEQQRVVETMRIFDDAVAAARTSLDRLRDLRSSLLSVLLSGEHEIPESYDRFLTDSEGVRAG